MRNKFDLKKTALTIATSAVVLSVHTFSMAQTDASLSMNGQIAAPTCLLAIQRMSSGFSTDTTAAQTYSFGTVDLSTLTVGATTTIHQIPFTINIRDSDGVTNCALVSNRWDIGLGINSTDVVQTSNGLTFIRNQSTASGAPKNIGLQITSAVTGGTRSNVNLTNAVPQFGVSLANNGVGATLSQGIAPVFHLGRTSASAVTPGAFSVVIPMNLWYR